MGNPAEQQYALVSDGQFVRSPSGHEHIVTFKPWPDERGDWLPIVNQDDPAPFNADTHYRLKPLPLRIDGELVLRVYPLIAKELA